MNKSIRKLIKTDQVLYTIGLNEDLTKEGFASFASADVYCLPVCNSEGNIVGMLDHADFARFVIQVFTRGSDTPAPSLRVADVMNSSGRDELRTLPVESATIGDAISALVTQQLHRICVTEGGRVKWLVSQWDVVNYFADKLPKKFADTQLCDLGRKNELGFLTKFVCAVDQHESVMHAFQLMDRHGITAVPVVDGGNNRLVGTLSLKDVPRVLDSLFEPCGKALKAVHGAACVELDSTFGSLLKGFQVTKLHRFWIIGDVNRLTGVISLTDAVRCLNTLFSQKGK